MIMKKSSTSIINLSANALKAIKRNMESANPFRPASALLDLVGIRKNCSVSAPQKISI